MSKQLDELVAARVMGWHKGAHSWLDQYGDSTGNLYDDSDDYYRPEVRWSPSECIGDAWMVIERVQALGKGWILVGPWHQGGFIAWQMTGCDDPDFGEYCATGETAERAICLAALVALDVPANERNAAFVASD